jgi:hypothetical protein
MEDFPKIRSPFVREHIDGRYVVTPQVEPGMEWVFESDDVVCVEKIDGTNVSIGVDRTGMVTAIRNRTNVIDCHAMARGPYIEGVRLAWARGRVPFISGQHFGELMGPKIQGNFLQLQTCEWFPFAYMRKSYYYKSWGKYEKDFGTISAWFRDDIFSLMAKVYLPGNPTVQPEGVIFFHTKTGRMAKLRLDMFDWWKGKQHKEE